MKNAPDHDRSPGESGPQSHLLCVIEELRARGERVFVVCGSSHAVCLEPAL